MKNGFTLVEIMIVMMALALLLLLTIPNVSKTVSIIENTGCKSQLNLIDSSILQFKLEQQRYPRDIAELVELGFIKTEHRYCQNGREIIIENHQSRLR